jgi:hypothetical protein
LTYGTLLRVFPVFFFGGWVVVAIAHAARAWRRREGADGAALDELISAPFRRFLAALPVLVATLAGFPDRFHLIAER